MPLFKPASNILLKQVSLLLCAFLFTSAIITAQVLPWSTYLGTDKQDNLEKICLDRAGNLYVIGTSFGEGFPVTPGAVQTYLGGDYQKLTVSKFSAAGKLLWSTYFGGSDYEIIPLELYWDAASNSLNVAAYSGANDYPVVNGNPKPQGLNYSAVLTQFNPTTGAVVYSTHVFTEAIDPDNNGIYGFRVKFEKGFAYYNACSADKTKYLVSKINLASHSFVYQTKFGGSNGVIEKTYGFPWLPAVVHNGEFYLAGATSASDFTVSAGAFQPAFPAGAESAYFITKLDANGNIGFSTFLGEAPRSIESLFPQLAVNDSEVAFGAGFYKGLPISPTGVPFDASEALNIGIVKLNKLGGDLLYSTYLGVSLNFTGLSSLNYVDGNLMVSGYTDNAKLYITANAQQPKITQNSRGSRDYFFTNIDAGNHIVYSGYWGGSGDENDFSRAFVKGSSIYFITSTNSADFPVTSNATQAFYSGDDDIAIIKFDVASNRITYSSYLGTNVGDYINEDPVIADDGTLYVCARTNPVWFYSPVTLSDFPVTKDALGKSIVGARTMRQYVAKINTNTGKLVYGSYIGSLLTGADEWESTGGLLVNGNDIIVAGTTRTNDYPVTKGALQENYFPGSSDMYITKITLCYDDIAADTLSPKKQEVCLNGQADTIYGSEPQWANVPNILRNGVAKSQAGQSNFSYQWQQSADNATWQNIDGATDRHYQPPTIMALTYFRRIVYSFACGNLDTSDIATVSLSGNIASNPDVGGNNGNFFTCPGNNVLLGTTTVAGLNYNWKPAANLTGTDIAQPVFNTVNPSVYTYILSATDGNGCVAQDTARIFNYTANAGPDLVLCSGKGSQIGGAPLAGVSNVTYSWGPSAGLSCTTCAQPIASQPGTYVLTVKILLPDGSNCTTTDNVTIGVADIPVNPAGPDLILCNKTAAKLGTPAVKGFTYNWSPGFFLSGIVNQSRPVFNQGLAELSPSYNPIEYIVTAVNPAGCTVVDTAKVYLLNVFAGYSQCRPYQLGKKDFTNGEATYQWVDVTNGTEQPIGEGELSATNIPNPFALANASITVDKVYMVKMTWKGVTCTSTVSVRANCICPSFGLGASSPKGCAIVDGSDSLTLFVVNPAYGYSYTWSPADGLNTTKGTSVKTGINTSITYTVTATNDNGPDVFCTSSIKVNQFSTAPPAFDAPDTTVCPSVVVKIGLPETVGWSYEWTSSDSGTVVLSTEANPAFIMTKSAVYSVRVTDVLTGCFVTDEVKVTVPDVAADAGPDRQSCSSGGFTIGTQAKPGLLYKWLPATGLNNPDIAQPTVLSNTADAVYTLLVTDPVSGCLVTDVINIEHVNEPTLASIAAPPAYCADGLSGNVQIGNEALSGVSYSWTPAAGLSDAFVAQPTANPVSTTTYTLTATFPGGCSATASQEVTVTVNPLPTASISLVNNCANSQLNASSNVAQPAFLWTPNIGLSNQNINNPVATVTAAIVYSVLVTDQTTGCTNTAQQEVLPSVMVNAGADQIICGNSSSQIGTAALANTTYSWVPATGLSNAAIAQPVFTASAVAGNYTYIVSATNGACTRKDTVVIKVNALPTVRLVDGVSICANGRVQLGIQPIIGYSYSWSPAAGLNNPNIANPIASPTTSTIYTLTVTNDFTSCSATASTSVAVNNTGAPIVNATGASICTGNVAQLSATASPAADYTYVWSPNQHFTSSNLISNPQVNPPSTTEYQVLVTNNSTGCSNIANATIIVKDTCGTLPVGWLEFTATFQANKVALQWAVATELNNKAFTIERSTNGEDWTSIYTTPSNGNTAQPRHYTAYDNSPLAGINYYRIKQVDIDGRSTYSVVRSVYFGSNGQPAFVVYPNPTHAFINYEYLAENGNNKMDLRLYSIEGKLLKQWQVNSGRGRLDMSAFPSGTYMLGMTDSKGKSINKKVVFQK